MAWPVVCFGNWILVISEITVEEVIDGINALNHDKTDRSERPCKSALSHILPQLLHTEADQMTLLLQTTVSNAFFLFDLNFIESAANQDLGPGLLFVLVNGFW